MKQIIIIAVSILAFLNCNKNTDQVSLANDLGNVPTIDSAYIASKTKYFTIKDYQFEGEATNAIKQMINESQFIVLGESHGSNETSILTAAMIPLVKKAGFDNFAVEVGPYSAKKLMELSKPADNTVKNMHDFYTNYYFKELDDSHIPFFHGVEDAKFLQAVAKNDIELWGLDQEYYSSIIYQADELLKLAKDKSNFEAIQKMKNEADKVIRKLYTEDEASDDGIDLFKMMLEDEKIKTFFSQFNEKDIVATELIKDIKISWDIYTRWRQGSHEDRISYMRENFMRNYNAKTKSGKTPKVLCKFGRLHTPQIISGGCYDVGHLANELATENGTVCSNISLLNRYQTFSGSMKDNLKGSVYYKRIKAIMVQGKMDEWTFIDLKSIRSDLKNGKAKLPKNGNYHDLRSLIEGFDYQIILPLDKYVEPNYAS